MRISAAIVLSLLLLLSGCFRKTETQDPRLHLASSGGQLWVLPDDSPDPVLLSSIPGSPIGLEWLPDNRLLTILTDQRCLGTISHATLQFDCEWQNSQWNDALGVSVAGDDLLLVLFAGRQLRLYDYSSQALMTSTDCGVASPRTLSGITGTMSGPNDQLLSSDDVLLLADGTDALSHLYLISLSGSGDDLTPAYLGDLPAIESITTDPVSNLLIGYHSSRRLLYRIDSATLNYTVDTLTTDPGSISGMAMF